MSTIEITAPQVSAAFSLLAGVSEAIREAGRIPSGTLYAVLIGKIDITGYQKIIGILKNAGLVEEKSHELIWIGPSFQVVRQ